MPASPVHTIGEALSYPQTLARNIVLELQHPEAGTTPHAIGGPIQFSATPTDSRAPAPLLGQHTRELLAEYGLSDDKIDTLIERGLVAQAD